MNEFFYCVQRNLKEDVDLGGVCVAAPFSSDRGSEALLVCCFVQQVGEAGVISRGILPKTPKWPLGPTMKQSFDGYVVVVSSDGVNSLQPASLIIIHGEELRPRLIESLTIGEKVVVVHQGYYSGKCVERLFAMDDLM